MHGEATYLGNNYISNQLNISKSCPKAVSIIPSDHTLANENSSWTSLYSGDAIYGNSLSQFNPL